MWLGEIILKKLSDSDSDSGSDSESLSDSDSHSEADKETYIVKTQTNKTEKRSLRTLRDFDQQELLTIWHDSEFFSLALERANLTGNQEYLAKILAWAADLIFHRNEESYFSKSLATYTRRFSLDNDLNPRSYTWCF